MVQKPKVAKDIVLHNIRRTHQGRPDRAPNSDEDIAAIANEAAVYVPHENHSNPSRKAKHQRDLGKAYFDHVGALSGQEDRT